MEVETVRLKCLKENNKLRIKIISPGYSSEANCQFPKNIRVDGREYIVHKSNVSLSNTRGKFFYRIKNSGIIIQDNVSKNTLKIYGDENITECCICMNDLESKPDIIFIIISPCGHYCCCKDCVTQLKSCPMCRGNIGQIVTKDQLQ